MIFTAGLATLATYPFLAFKVKEYASVAYREDTNITKLSVIAFNSAKTMSVANCTFNWTTVDITLNNNKKNEAFTYISNCHQNLDTDTIKIGTATETTILKTTAKFDDFLAFDTINIYYDNVLYYSINPTTAKTVGFTPLTFFSGQMTDYKWVTGENFDKVSQLLTSDKPFSTVDAKLFIAKFQGDYSYLIGSVRDDKDTVLCNLFFTSLNEAVCKLKNSAAKDKPENFYLILKNSAGNVVIKHAFTRWFEVFADGDLKDSIKTKVGQTVERTVIGWTIPSAPPTTDSKSNPVLTTSFMINLKDNSTKSAVDLNDNSCPVVNVLVQSNGTTLVNTSNVSPDITKGYCYITVSSNTNALVPWTDFVLNATYPDGKPYISTTAKLTPRMISDWAANSLNGSTPIIALSDINKSGLTGGEVAAIVIGSCAGALLVALLAGIFIRWCAYGCMNPATIAAPKMMM